jgi:prepilin peptidase CpaA
MHAIQIPLLLIFPALAIVAALKDVTSYTIPNWISLALIAAFVPAAPPAEPRCPPSACAWRPASAPCSSEWVCSRPAGSAAATPSCSRPRALWIGWPAAMPFMLATGLAGGALTMGILALRSGWVEPVLAGGPAWLRKLGGPRTAISPTAWPSRSAPWPPSRRARWPRPSWGNSLSLVSG